MVTSFLIKPASSLCNMRCRYCFYEDESKRRKVKNMGIMPQEISEKLIAAAFAVHHGSAPVTFAFQGGEPTLAGKEFFSSFTEQVERYNKNHVPVNYSIQTNGYDLDDEWINFLTEHHFLIGISIDGDKALHDSNRINTQGKGTWNRVTQNLQKLLRRGADVNILCVVTKQCARSPQKVYTALKKLGVGFLQFIACLDPMDGVRGSESYSLTPEIYGDFLCRLFDLWYRDWELGQYVSIRMFDDLVHLTMGLPAGTCAASGSCGNYLVIEADGSAYPCDFYVLDEWRLGRIGEDTVETMANGETAARFLQDSLVHPLECCDCRWQYLCNSGCKRDWVMEKGSCRNYYCEAFQKLFAHAEERLQQIARAELRLQNGLRR